MSRVRVKVCGMTRVEDVREACTARCRRYRLRAVGQESSRHRQR